MRLMPKQPKSTKPTKSAASDDAGAPEGFKAAIRAFIAAKGKPIAANGGSYYNGYEDGEAHLHTDPDWGGCGWIVPEGVVMTETSYVEWGGTFGTDSHEIGIDLNSTPTANIRCTCGQYENMSLRFEGTFGEVLLGALGSGSGGDQPGIVL